MKIWVHGYTLTPRHSGLAKRRGALLKVEWELGQVGYSDLHPWPEFGEAPLDMHLEALSSLAFTRLSELSLEFNYIDREFRSKKRNAFLGLIIPGSHYLVPDLSGLTIDKLNELTKEGYTHIKLKLGWQLRDETKKLAELIPATELMWRLDFGGRVAAEEFTEWWTGLDQNVVKYIDFVEDPIPGGALKIDGPWANDWYKVDRARVRVIKPARENLDDVGAFRRIVFTHGLDHPLGQACAAWMAGRFYSAHPRLIDVCGLSGGDIYEPDEFSEQWISQGPRLKPTTGLGFGFDESLESIKWERLF